MIVVSTFKQRYNGKPTVFASHLTDIDTLEQFPCPQVPISEMSSTIRYDYLCEREYPPPLGGRYSITKERNTGDGSERSPFDFCHFP